MGGGYWSWCGWRFWGNNVTRSRRRHVLDEKIGVRVKGGLVSHGSR